MLPQEGSHSGRIPVAQIGPLQGLSPKVIALYVGAESPDLLKIQRRNNSGGLQCFVAAADFCPAFRIQLDERESK